MPNASPITVERMMRRWPVALLLLAASAAPLRGQDTAAAQGTPLAPERRVRLIVSGGLNVPTGGFSDYHDLGVQASGSALIRVVGRKFRLRPEVAYARFGVLEDKVRRLAQSAGIASVTHDARAPGRARLAQGMVAGASARVAGGPKLPDLGKLRDGAISSVLGTFANIEIPLGPRGFQPYLIGGVGAVSFRTDVTTVGEAINGVQWAYNAGAGLRFRLGPIGGGLEARFRGIPVDEAKTFFHNVAAIPVAFSLVF